MGYICQYAQRKVAIQNMHVIDLFFHCNQQHPNNWNNPFSKNCVDILHFLLSTTISIPLTLFALTGEKQFLGIQIEIKM